MAGLPGPAGDERQNLINFLAFQQDAFAAVAHGLPMNRPARRRRSARCRSAA
ncbi:hypothetical protein MAUB1S_00007 [Mycolicibacterium aubagnense]